MTGARGPPDFVPHVARDRQGDRSSRRLRVGPHAHEAVQQRERAGHEQPEVARVTPVRCLSYKVLADEVPFGCGLAHGCHLARRLDKRA
jgi:hypothetical protein